MKIKKNAGFTLIELLVVVLIVGILASIAIPQYFKAVEKSRIAEAMSVMATIKSAQERYLAGSGAYASDLNNLDISYSNLTTAVVSLRYFNGGLSTTAGTSYVLTLTRTTTNSSVTTRYGSYSVAVSVPASPVATISNCPGASCDELLK